MPCRDSSELLCVHVGATLHAMLHLIDPCGRIALHGSTGRTLPRGLAKSCMLVCAWQRLANGACVCVCGGGEA